MRLVSINTELILKGIKIKNSWALTALLVTGMFTATGSIFAGEKEIGEPVIQNGLKIEAVYLQPVTMSPTESMSEDKDVHLEADIQAADGAHGFSAGDWVPYLEIAFFIQKVGSDWSAHGSFMPMIANDGPHYGANVKLDGPGEYKLDYEIVPPVRNGLYRHTDEETGIDPWWAPFHVSWTFAYIGVGKKGAY